MRGTWALLLATLALLLAPTGLSTTPPPAGVADITYGGVELPADASGSEVISHADLPTIVEMLTADWCDPCLEAEDELARVAENHSIRFLAHHRYTNEPSDPFGTAEGEARIARESPPSGIAPPIMVLHGHHLHQGLNHVGHDSLAEAYEASLLDAPAIPTAGGSSDLAWTTEDGRSGTVQWVWTPPMDWPARGDTIRVEHVLMIVEHEIEHEGLNGAPYQHEVVRQVIALKGDTGHLALSLPAPIDGDDLSLVLVHDVVPIIPGEEKGIPAAGLLVLLIALLVGAAAHRPSRD